VTLAKHVPYEHPNPSFEPNRSAGPPADFVEDRSAVHAFDVSRGRAPQRRIGSRSIGAASVGRRHGMPERDA
jgi:hypothetical protein